jgi:DNA-binding MarR family transcriptional regulator
MDQAEIEDRSTPCLMHQIVGKVEALVNQWARPLGLKIEGVRVLFRLLAGDRTVNELARLTGVELSTLSRLLSRMESMGLITRRRDVADGRSVNVALAPKGRKLALRHQPVYFKDYEAILMKGFSPAEARQFRELVVRMLGNLENSTNPVSGPVTETGAEISDTRRASA